MSGRADDGPRASQDVEEVLANEAYPIDLSRTVSANTPQGSPETKEYELEFDVEVTSVILGWPDGTQNAVPMNLGTIGQRFIPFNADEEWIAFEDFVYAFDVRTVVKEGEVITAKYFNLTSDDKFVNCVPQIREL